MGLIQKKLRFANKERVLCYSYFAHKTLITHKNICRLRLSKIYEYYKKNSINSIKKYFGNLASLVGTVADKKNPIVDPKINVTKNKTRKSQFKYIKTN